MAAKKAETSSMTVTPNLPTDDPAKADDPGAIEQIRRAHESARPKPSNPSWHNCHRDCGVLLAAVEALQENIAEYDTLFELAEDRERPWVLAWQKACGQPDTFPDYGKILAWICDRAEVAEARVAELKAHADAIQKAADFNLHKNLTIAKRMAEARVKELEALVKDGVRRSQNCMEWQSRAQAAEARELVRVEALEIIAGTRQPTDNLMSNQDIALTALATTPAEVLEGARAAEDTLAESCTLFDLCWNAIETAINHEGGLDSSIGQSLMTEIRDWQAKLDALDKEEE